MQRTYCQVKNAAALALLMMLGASALSQVEMNDLYVPTSPAFVLADKAPASIEKPTSIRSFGVMLLSLRNGGAMESTPFWLFRQPHYSFDDYVKNRTPLIESSNLSIATYRTDSNSVVAAGFRTQLVRIFSSAILQKEQEIIDLLSNEKPPVEKINAARKELESLRRRPLLSIEAAAAILGGSANNSFRDLVSMRSGVWTNIRYSPERLPFDLIGLSRFSWTNNATSKTGRDSSFMDFGLSLSYAQAKYDVAIEYIHRNDIAGKKTLHRVAGIINYMVADDVVLVASVGKNFDRVDNIIAVFGVKFGLSTRRIAIR